MSVSFFGCPAILIKGRVALSGSTLALVNLPAAAKSGPLFSNLKEHRIGMEARTTGVENGETETSILLRLSLFAILYEGQVNIARPTKSSAVAISLIKPINSEASSQERNRNDPLCHCAPATRIGMSR